MSGSTTIVIFGASGDLTRRKLVPGLYNLFLKKRLPERFNVVGISRTAMTHDEWRGKMQNGVQEFSAASYDAAVWDAFAGQLWYTAGSADQLEDLEHILGFLKEKEQGPAHRLYYLSVSPELYIPIIQNLGKLDMAKDHVGETWRRIVIEKPFGVDLKSAHALNAEVQAVFNENQIYRIDHYLGKETAQNILFLRFANAIFEPVWNRNYVDNVQISALEQVDVEHRGAYYDKSGVLRDMFQNHLLQLMALIAMEPPASLDGNALRSERTKVLTAVRSIDPFNAVLAQYEGYRQTKGVASDSVTPTYAALRLDIDNWRWQGVPFYLRSGKALKRKATEITVIFRQPPHMMFDHNNGGNFAANKLSICIQPDEGIHLSFEAKLPDSARRTRSVDMEFHYAGTFGESAIPEAYERLILDALTGDPSLFTRSDGIETSWELMDPIIGAWEAADGPGVVTYKKGMWGPPEADELLTSEGRSWQLGCVHER